MRYSILGPLAVRDGRGGTIPVGGARLRRLLVLLLLEPGRMVATDRLIDGIWGEEDTPAGAGNALQALVSRLRRVLGGGVTLHGDIAGYRLETSRFQVDLYEFEDLVSSGRRLRADGDPRGAARNLGEALSLWRGPALADLYGTGAAEDTVVRLEELRRSVVEERLACQLDSGDHRSALPDIEALAVRDPLRERPVELLMRALDASGRQADALAAYDRLRRGLTEELGIDPSSHVQELHVRLLRGELQQGATPRRGPRPPVTRLPRALTSFVARGEMDTAVDLLRSQRLVTMTGPGGAGKTRLSIETGAAVAERNPELFTDGVWFVDLAPLRDGAEIPHAVLSTLGLRERSFVVMQAGAAVPPADPVDRIVEALAPQSLLLILDNCEHLVLDTAELVERLLAAAPGLRILATSREPLSVGGERLLAVPSLTLPPENTPAGRARDYPSVRLFVERVAAVSPGFTVDERNIGHIVRICRDLDGMPLALELAAARVRAMSLPQLAARLCDRFRLLTNGSRSALPRHQTLQAVVDWSWELLDGVERTLLRRFSVFAGGAHLDAVERVCGDSGGPEVGGRDVWSVLFALVDKSLVVADPLPFDGGEPRYRMLETVRAYAAQRLTESGEEVPLRRAHAGYVLRVWDEADPKLRTSEQLTWLSRLRAEHDNLTAALRWSIDTGDVLLALDLNHAAQWYWQMADAWTDLCRWSGEIIGLVGEQPPEGRAVAYAECVFVSATAGEAAGVNGDSGVLRAEEVLRQAGEVPENHRTLIFLPVYLVILGHNRQEVLRRLEDCAVERGPWLHAMAKELRGLLMMQGGSARQARDLLMEALEDFRHLGDRWGVIHAVAILGELVRLSDPEHERALLDEGIGLAREMGISGLDALLRGRRASALADRGETGAARRAIAEIGTVGLEYDCVLMLRLAEAVVERAAGAASRAQSLLRGVVREVETMGRAIRGQAEPICYALLARTAMDLGDREQARRYAATAWKKILPGLEAVQEGLVLEVLAEQVLDEHPERAALLLGCAESVRGLANETESDVVRLRTEIRKRIGDAGFDEAYRKGAATAHEDIVADVGTWIEGRARDI